MITLEENQTFTIQVSYLLRAAGCLSMVYQGCSACHTVMRTRVKDASLNEDHRIIDFSDHTEKGAFSADLQPRTGRIEMREKKKRKEGRKNLPDNLQEDR
ncbi:hypothetical protein V6Z92_005457 [Aspergillus fumigatus]